MLIGNSNNSEKETVTLGSLVKQLLGGGGEEGVEEKKDFLTPKQREELSKLQKEIESAKALIVHAREDVVTSEEQELEMVVKTLEEKLGVQAPEGAQPHEKLNWLMTELQSRNSEEKILILKELKGKNFKDKQLAETVNNGLKKEVQDEILHKAKDSTAENVKDVLEQLEGDPDKSQKARIEHKEFKKDMERLLISKQKEANVKNKSNNLEHLE